MLQMIVRDEGTQTWPQLFISLNFDGNHDKIYKFIEISVEISYILSMSIVVVFSLTYYTEKCRQSLK